MKEAAGEANMTVITIVLIGIVAAVGAILVPRVLDGSSKKAACAEVGGNLSGSTCTFKDYSSNSSGQEVNCIVKKCPDGHAKSGQYVCANGTSGINFGSACS